jgi:hypothetical protein
MNPEESANDFLLRKKQITAKKNIKPREDSCNFKTKQHFGDLERERGTEVIKLPNKRHHHKMQSSWFKTVQQRSVPSW